ASTSSAGDMVDSAAASDVKAATGAVVASVAVTGSEGPVSSTVSASAASASVASASVASAWAAAVGTDTGESGTTAAATTGADTAGAAGALPFSTRTCLSRARAAGTGGFAAIRS